MYLPDYLRSFTQSFNVSKTKHLISLAKPSAIFRSSFTSRFRFIPWWNILNEKRSLKLVRLASSVLWTSARTCCKSVLRYFRWNLIDTQNQSSWFVSASCTGDWSLLGWNWKRWEMMLSQPVFSEYACTHACTHTRICPHAVDMKKCTCRHACTLWRAGTTRIDAKTERKDEKEFICTRACTCTHNRSIRNGMNHQLALLPCVACATRAGISEAKNWSRDEMKN